jgi:hypothetical protein
VQVRSTGAIALKGTTPIAGEASPGMTFVGHMTGQPWNAAQDKYPPISEFLPSVDTVIVGVPGVSPVI